MLFRSTKGNAVIIQGDLTIRPWEGKEGKKGTSLEVNVDKIRFVPSGEKNGNGNAPVAGSASRNAAPSADIDDGDCPF